MRRDVVKGTADAIKKSKYLAMNNKVKAKEQQIEEAKQLVDGMIEKRRQELQEKHAGNLVKKEKPNMVFIEKHKKYTIEQESELAE